jgi:hypothetical protein
MPLREWVGGIVRVPAYVSGEGEPYRPDALFWLGAEGDVVVSKVAKPGELLVEASDHLRLAIERAQAAGSSAPTRIRVASPDLAAAIRRAFPAMSVVCANTPEIEALQRAMRERFEEDAQLELSYLAGGLRPDAMGELFTAANGLFQVAPWRSIPSDQHLLFVTIGQLGLRDAVLSVVGQMGQNRGLILFSNSADFEAYLAAGAALERGERPRMAPHLALTFERGAELAPFLRKQIVSHAWPVAGPGAYPWLAAAEVTTITVLARALPELLAEAQPALVAAWSGGTPVLHTQQIRCQDEEYGVTWLAANELDPGLGRPVDDVLHGLLQRAQRERAPGAGQP